MANPAKEIITLEEFETYAAARLDQNAFQYYRSGADQEKTLKENVKAFSRLRFRPRFMRDVSVRDLSTTILGQRISFPVAVAPTAMQKMAHPDGELATARAAAGAETLMGLSTMSTISLEDVAAISPYSPKWFQLYVFKDRESSRKLIQRAEKAGYKAILLTVDTPILGTRLADMKNKFQLPPHMKLGNFDSQDQSSEFKPASDGSALSEYATAMLDSSLTWKDLAWLKSITTLPIVVKGVLTAEDAILSLQHGASAILVSNHGARQLDGDPATIEVLPEVVKAVNGRCEVYLDGGVRTGTDVLKALALGARCVFIGRPILWGLTHSGENGARQVLEILRHELDVAMALTGCKNLGDVNQSLVTNNQYFSKL